jgi:hypothetical protein
MGAYHSNVNDERSGETGRFAPKYERKEFIEAIRAGDTGATTTEIADYVDCPQTTAYDRLTAMYQAGEIRKRDVGAAVLWILTEEVNQ